MSGPFLDEVQYHIITQDDQQVIALQDNEIDLIGNTIDPSFLVTLQEAANIEVDNTLRNGYGYLTINTQKFPLNYTALRRAIAFALDKEHISDEIWDGLSVPQDSPIPQINPVSVEGFLDFTYYEPEIARANSLLDDAGFTINQTSGFRDAPNGRAFNITIQWPDSSYIAIEITTELIKAIESLHIDIDIHEPVCWHCAGIWNSLYFHWDYDIIFLGSSFSSFDVDWLGREFHSEYSTIPYYNFANFRNDTYDFYADILLHSIDYDEVQNAAERMQEILVYECPIIVCYENLLLSAYRTDRFTEFVNDVSKGVPGWWTNFKVQLKQEEGGPFGGTLRWSNALDLDTYNPLISHSVYTRNVLDNLFDSLFKIGPNGEDIPWMVESFTVETHEDNQYIPDGHTRFVFDIRDGLTWSDGSQITADDVAYALNKYRDLEVFGYYDELANMTAAYSRTPSTLAVEFNTESYWHLHSIAYKPIIRRNMLEGIGSEDWDDWDESVFNGSLVYSGPYQIQEHVLGEYISLQANPYYLFRPEVPETTPLSTTNESGSNVFFDYLFDPSLSYIVTAVSVTVIAFVIIRWYFFRKTSS